MEESRTNRLIAELFLVTALTIPAAQAQISGIQGAGAMAPAADDSANVHYYYSPMILTAPFPLTDRKQWGTPAWSNNDIMDPLSYYRCDNVAISDMQMRGDLLPSGDLHVLIRGKLENRYGHDRRVTLKFELLNGDSVISTNETAPLKANDDSKTRFKYDFAVPANSIGAAPATRMRVTVSTKLD
jgi:hypothetical protein